MPVTCPHHIPVSCRPRRFGRGLHSDAHMRPPVVVEVHGPGDRRHDLVDVPEHLPLEQLVLHRVVDAFRLGVVLRISRLGHADPDAVLPQHPHILAARILAATVGVVYEVDLILPLYASQRHPQGLHRIVRVKRGPDTPADDLLAVCVKYQRQVAEVAMVIVLRYDNVCYVADPQPIRRGGNIILYEVGVCRESVCRVRRARLAHLPAHLQPLLVDDPAEAVAAYRTVKAEVPLIHVPQLLPADAGIFLPDFPDILDGELLTRGLGMDRVLVMLIVSLLAYTKQPAELNHLTFGG